VFHSLWISQILNHDSSDELSVTLLISFSSAPAFNNRAIISRFPLYAAIIKGVKPFLSGILGSAPLEIIKSAVLLKL